VIVGRHGAARHHRAGQAAALCALFVLASIAACNSGPAAADRSPKAAPAAPASVAPRRADPVRDLSIDESMGGHTLARHVGRSDAELAERLRREPQISSASTYLDRQTAQRVVGAVLASRRGEIAAWQERAGRRPNLVLHYVSRDGASIGRSLGRGRREPVPCPRAIVVLRWDDRRDRFFVLTSYPEAER
jgi:CDI toxin RNase A-like protein